MSDDLSPEERRAIAELPKLSPPPGFAAQVVATHRRGVALRRVGAIAAAAAVALGGAYTIGHGAVEGALVAQKTRASVELGGRGVAVAESGAALRWRVDRGGAARVEQTAGNVFYRVEPGGSFVVSTIAGEVTVTGTCFRVEVPDVKSLASAGLGATLATLVTVTVYEGRVTATAANADPLPVSAGESATLDGKRAEKRAPSPVIAQIIAEAERERPRAPLPANLDAPALYAAHDALAKEADRLRDEVQTLSKRLAEVEDKGGRTRRNTYDVPKEDLLKMAERCQLGWDTPPLSSELRDMSVKHAEQAGLSEEERAAVSKRMRESQQAMIDHIRKIYVETTGDNTGGSLAPESMLEEIEDKTPSDERKRVFQALSRERAGLAQAPPPGTQESAYMRLYREMTAMGDQLERAIAEDLGPETARKIRDVNQGWGSVHHSSNGCPEN